MHLFMYTKVLKYIIGLELSLTIIVCIFTKTCI
jgi:hypothetical protein